MWIAIWTALGFGVAAIFLAALLAVPLDLTFEAEKADALKARVRLEWMFGLVKADIGSSGKQERPERILERGRRMRGVPPVGDGAFLGAVFRLVRRLVKSLRVRELHVDARVGLDDPAETGMAFGLIGPVAGLIAALPGTDINVAPDFDAAGVRGEARGSLRAYPIRAVLAVAAFAATPATWRAMRTGRRARA